MPDTRTEIEPKLRELLRASEEPCRWIASNAGLEGSIVVAKIRDAKDARFGFNAQTERYEDLVAAERV